MPAGLAKKLAKNMADAIADEHEDLGQVGTKEIHRDGFDSALKASNGEFVTRSSPPMRMTTRRPPRPSRARSRKTTRR